MSKPEVMMKPKLLWTALCALIGLALAQVNGEVKLELKAFRVITTQESGKTSEKLEPALDVKPGQVVEYRLEASNTTDRPLSRVALTIPIPKNTYYQALSAQPLQYKGALIVPEFSFDSGQSFGKAPLKRKVRVSENGQEVEKELEVKPEEYTHVRWVIPQLGAKETVVLTLRAVVR